MDSVFDFTPNRDLLKSQYVYILKVFDKSKVGEQPICTLLVERKVAVEKDGERILSARLKLDYRCITARYSTAMSWHGCFSAHYAAGFDGQPRISLVSSIFSDGAFYVDPEELRGHGVGTFFMNEIVEWAKQWPDAIVCPIKLLAAQADAKNKSRRNRFYEQFGLIIDFTDPDQLAGATRQMPTSALNLVEVKDNIQMHSVQGWMGEALTHERDMLFETTRREKVISELRQELDEAQSKPFAWAIRTWWWKHAPNVYSYFFVAGFGLLLWFKYK
jgi:GNAT superfamily N-acetyltransferase